MTRATKDVGASVRARLLYLSHERGEDFQLLLTRYANERLLYRLSSSPHASGFVLKGAALFALWTGKPHRTTRDLNLLGFGEPSEAHVARVFADVVALHVDDDGVVFNPASLEVGPIREEQEYGGVRVTLVARVTAAQVKLQVDVGFGDIITPAATVVDYPALLNFAAPRLRAYPRETVVAEKLQAMVQLGLANSRMKDFYDIWVLARGFAFEGASLTEAIRRTFERRRTPIPDGTPVSLTTEFSDDPSKAAQWRAFVRKSRLVEEAPPLAQVAVRIGEFVLEPLGAAHARQALNKQWPPSGPWVRPT